MPHIQNPNIQEETDIKKVAELILKNYKLFIAGSLIAFSSAFLFNRYSVPTYSVSSSILIQGNNSMQSGSGNGNDFLYSNLFGGNQNFQNELWILKSYPVVETTARNLDLSVLYFSKGKFNYYELYKEAPFIVSFLPDHPQPRDIMFTVTFLSDGYFNVTAESKNATFLNFEKNKTTHLKKKWNFSKNGKLGELIETEDLAFIIESRDTTHQIPNMIPYGFKFRTLSSLSAEIARNTEFMVVDRQATVVKITLITESQSKGIDIINELMNVYSDQNLERKNHLATITIDYIEKQLSEISDSLNIAEDNLQRFRSSRQLLNITDQATVISSQYMDLQNQLAELVSRKRYFDYVSDLLKNDDFSNLMLPASIGISDQLLNTLMGELLNAQAQRANLIANNQERNPLVQNFGIQIENLKKTISENISAFSNTASISIDEMNKRIRRTEAEINRLPATQRQLGTFERKYRLNDAIYNYLMEKHAEAKITQASNLPDDIIIEQAKGKGQVSPDEKMNYLIALLLGLGLPLVLILLKNALNNKIESQDDLERLTSRPLLGKIPHNRYKTKNVMFEFPKSSISESFRALRTNLEFYVRGGQRKVILVTSCFEQEGKSFIALNLAMSYAQLGKKTILLDLDLRKTKSYFNTQEPDEGLSSFMIDQKDLEDIISKSPNENLDYIAAGVLPPNPAELLALDKTEKLISKLKTDYEIIVLDTPPVAQVTDAYLLMNYSDVKIIIVRYSQTIKNIFSLVMKDLEQKNVSNTCIVMNDNRINRDQYGYGYGYYDKKGLFKKKTKTSKRKVGELTSKPGS